MPLPVLTVPQMRYWEQASWDAGRVEAEVIRQAGRCVAALALRLTRSGDRILVLAGKGHNGDDARCAVEHLLDRRTNVYNVVEPGAALADLKPVFAERPALVIDGLFGIGLSRPLDQHWTELIEELNAASLPVLAVDVPSGLNAETGEPQNIAVVARATLTFGGPKIGLLKAESYHFTGRLEVAPDIGLVPCPFETPLQLTVTEDFAGFPPARRVDGHKGTFGHASIVAGSLGYHGAAVLAARSALRACPGLVSVLCAPDVYMPVASQLQAAMVHPFAPGTGLPPSTTALLIGPGLAAPGLEKRWRDFANEQWKTLAYPVVVDASALDWIEPGPTALNSRRFLTPHPGEAARLLKTATEQVQKDRPAALREISARYGNCWVVLKGHHTLVGRSTGELFINSSGNPWLAQGGSGDALAGFLTGLLAQPRLQAQPLKTLRYAVWEHGASADRLTSRGTPWTIAGLLEEIGEVV